MEKDLKREQAILDKGYDAVRTMARDMVQNGASLADILSTPIKFGMSSR